MDIEQLIFLGLVFVVVVAGTAGVALLLSGRRTRQRLDRLAGDRNAPPDTVALSGWIDAGLKWIEPAGRLSTPEEGFEASALKRRFVNAGLRSASAPNTFFALKTVLTLALPTLALAADLLDGALLQGQQQLLVPLLLAALGYYAPNAALAWRIRHRQRELFEAFPDALDLMTVCVEAGLGLEAAMIRVADDIAAKSPALAEEMQLLNLELRAGLDRPRALRNLAWRTGVEEIDSFATMMIQAERFGTSVATSLRIQSDLLRTRRRQQAEEAAAKIGLKLLFPLMFCIFPALLVVLIGPAGLQLIRALSSMG